MKFKKKKKGEMLLQAKAKEKLENEKVRKVLVWIFQITVTLVFAAVIAIAMFQSVTMQESSMEPTISVGDRFFMDRVSYKVSSPQRGDIIVFKTNASDDAALHIRRVIGLPGETIQILDGRILIDGEIYWEGKDFPSISNPGLQKIRFLWKRESTLFWGITGTTAKTADTGISAWSRSGT